VASQALSLLRETAASYVVSRGARFPVAYVATLPEAEGIVCILFCATMYAPLVVHNPYVPRKQFSCCCLYWLCLMAATYFGPHRGPSSSSLLDNTVIIYIYKNECLYVCPVCVYHSSDCDETSVSCCAHAREGL
jgi:hypothetical protein